MNLSPRILWFAIVFSTVIYMVLLLMLVPNPAGSFEESINNTRTLVFYGLAFAAFVTGLVLPPLLKSEPRQKLLITMNVFEICAIFGLVAAFMQQDWRVYIPAWILAAAGFIRAFPKEEQVAF